MNIDQTTGAEGKLNLHYFSRKFAEEHGVKEAIVLKFLAHKVRRSKNVRNDKKWFFDPIRELAHRYPYIPKSTMDKILKRLESKKLLEIDNFNRRGYDRTGWYTVPQDALDAVEKRPLIKVDVEVANELGIPAGVLIENLRFWVQQKAKKRKRGDTTTIYHEMSPARLAIDLPCFDLSTIKRALKSLVKSSVPRIVKHPTLKALYTLLEMVQDGGPERDKAGPNRDTGGAERDNTGSKRDEGGSKRDNNTHCKPLSNTIGNSVGKPFKEEVQASPAPAFESNSGRTDDKVLAKGPDSPQDGHSDSPSSPGIKGCAGHVKDSGENNDSEGGMDDPITYDQLKTINKEQQSLFNYKAPKIRYEDQPEDDPGSVSVSFVRSISSSFVDSLPNATIRTFIAIEDIDKLVAEVKTLLLPYFQSTIHQYNPEESPRFKTVKPTFFRASLEFVVTSIASLRDKRTFYGHSINNLWPYICHLSQEMFNRLFKENGKLWQEWYEKNKKQHVSVDEAKEPDPALAPAKKTRVLRNALQARNAWGYFNRYNEYVGENRFIFNQADLEVAEKLFELNRGFCVAQLLDLIDRCAEIRYCELMPEGFDKYFHARQGCKLGWFLKHLTTIAGELDSPLFSDWVSLPKPVEGADEGEPPGSAEPAEVGPKAIP
ncbi:MAG: hypothetical protein HZA88_20525 [Verrucomicrobia bacterium]|nr:hypothetical protein [Verrucomicrobiota bacterium]